MDHSDFSEDPGLPQEAESDRYGEHAKSPCCGPAEDVMDTEMYGSGHEETDQFAPELGGGSHDDPVCRDWRSYDGSWPTGLARSLQHVEVPHLVQSSEDVNWDQHEVKQPLQCTDDEGVDSVMSENSQPSSVQSMASSMVEEPCRDDAVLAILPKSSASRQALKLYDELCVGVTRPLHGTLQDKHCVQLVKVVQDRVKVQDDQLLVPLHASSPCLSIEEFLWTPGFESMVENGSLCIMSALFQYIRAVGNCHGVPDRTGAMYGAFSKLSDILFCPITRRLEEPEVYLQPSLHKFVEAVEKTCDGWIGEEDIKKGRRLDIRAVCSVLTQILPVIQKKERLRVSGTMQRNLELAIQLCMKATTGQLMADIVRTLHCDLPLSMLSVKGRVTVDIVCYKGEKILSVFKDWMTCGAHTLSRQPCLYYDGAPQCRVLPDHEVSYPESSVTLAAAVT